MGKWRISPRFTASSTLTLPKKAFVRVAVLIAWLLIWQLVSMLVDLELWFPAPLSVLYALIALIPQGAFWTSVFGSIFRITVGYLIGCAIGALLGTASYFISAVKAMFSPLMSVIKATPVASFILLIILWLKPAGVPILISALMVIPIVYGNVYSGLAAHSKELREVAFVYGFSPSQCARHLFIPAVLPYFGTACATSFGLAWKAGVAAEVLCLTPDSIGLGLYTAKLYLETPQLFALTAVVIILSLMLEYLLKKVIKLAYFIKKSSPAEETSDG